MSESIISNKRECLVCKTTQGLHKHHIFYGMANRKLSEREGCWCYLCGRHHNMSNAGVHFNKELDKALKEYCQKKWQIRNVRTEDDFREIFGRSYL